MAGTYERNIVLRSLKPQSRSMLGLCGVVGVKKVSQSNRLLFKETVRAGKAKATVYKRLKLVRR